MNILVACEESQRVCEEFRKKGHNAFSCDIIDCSGGHPEWHIKGDVLKVLNGNTEFKTQDGNKFSIPRKWDMIIAFPPCTHLAVSGARHFEKKRKDGRQKEGIEFFMKIMNADCDKVAIENPVNIISGDYIKEYFPDLCNKYNLPIKPTQHIQPYEFGDKARKKTCLWLKGLNPLMPTEIVIPEIVRYKTKSGKMVSFSKDYVSGFTDGDVAKSRSKTYLGVAKAMAEQWG